MLASENKTSSAMLKKKDHLVSLLIGELPAWISSGADGFFFFPGHGSTDDLRRFFLEVGFGPILSKPSFQSAFSASAPSTIPPPLPFLPRFVRGRPTEISKSSNI